MKMNSKSVSYQLALVALVAYPSVRAFPSLPSSFPCSSEQLKKGSLIGGAVAGYLALTKVAWDSFCKSGSCTSAGGKFFGQRGKKQSRISQLHARLSGVEALGNRLCAALEGLDKRLADRMAIDTTDLTKHIQELRTKVDSLSRTPASGSGMSAAQIEFMIAQEMKKLSKTSPAVQGQPAADAKTQQAAVAQVRDSLKKQLHDHEVLLAQVNTAVSEVKNTLAQQAKASQETVVLGTQYRDLRAIVGKLESELKLLQSEVAELDEEVFVFEEPKVAAPAKPASKPAVSAAKPAPKVAAKPVAKSDTPASVKPEPIAAKPAPAPTNAPAAPAVTKAETK